MEGPMKKKSFVSRMFRALTVYFFITLAVFFGYVELYGGVKTIFGTLPEIAQGEMDMSFSNFVTNMMSMQNIYVEGVELKFDGGGTAVSLDADVAVDIATKHISVDAKLNVDGHEYDVGAVYMEPEVFVSIDGRTYRFETASINGDIDLTSAVNLFSKVVKALDIDFGGLEKFEEALGIDFSTMNMATLIDHLDISTKKSSGKVMISIIFMDHIEAIITCDENCFMQSASVRALNVGANSLTIEVPTVNMNDVDIRERIKAPDDENILDMAPINEYVSLAEDFFTTNDYTQTDITVDVNGKTYEAKLDVDNSNGTKIKLSTEVEGYKLSAIYADEMVYLTVNDFSLSMATKDVMPWIDRIGEIIEMETSKSVKELAQEILEKYVDVEKEKTLVDKLKALAQNFLSSSANISVVLPDSVTEQENSFVMGWGDTMTVTLSKENDCISALNVECEGINVNATFAVAEKGFDIPTDCEDLSGILRKVDNLMQYIESGVYAFGFEIGYDGHIVSGNFKYTANMIEISNVLVGDDVATIRIEDGYIYLDYANKKLKYLVPKNDGTFESEKAKVALAKLTSDAFGTKIDLGVFEELIDMILNYSAEDWKTNIVPGVFGNQDDITVTASKKDSENTLLTANVTFEDDKISGATVSIYDILTATITDVDYDPTPLEKFTEEEYAQYAQVDISPLTDYVDYATNLFASDYVEVNAVVTVNGKHYLGKLNLDNTNGVAFRFEVEVEGYTVVVAYANDMVYLAVNDLAGSISTENLLKWKDRILEIVETKTSKNVEEVVKGLIEKYAGEGKNIKELLKEYIAKLSAVMPTSAEETENQFVMKWADSLVVTLSKDGTIWTGLKVEYGEGITADITLAVAEGGFETPETGEDLDHVLQKADNLMQYIENGEYAFKFTANYNGFELAGDFKYQNKVFAIMIGNVDGENANIRIEGDQIYFDYGNMKFRFDRPKNDGTFESAKAKQMLEKITADTFGVKIEFGVFEELVDMILNFSKEDLMTQLVPAISGNQDDIKLTLSKKDSENTLLRAEVTFEDDKISGATVSIYDILTVTITEVYSGEEAQIPAFNADKYGEYKVDFVDGMLDSLRVAEGVYGFSSDVAIRYSETAFYGEISAMLVKNEDDERAIAGYVPALSIHTTSLGLNSFIYVVGTTLYIDINGLQLSADISKTTIDEIMNFVQVKLGIKLKGEEKAVEKTVEAFRVILPALDKIYLSWINEIEDAETQEKGIQIKLGGNLWYGEKSRFEDIVIQAFINNDSNIIMPTKIIVGANIIDPNTLKYDDYSEYWLTNGTTESGEKILLEEPITQKLNFGAYFTNMNVGTLATETLEKVYAIQDRNFKDITSVLSNYTTSKLEDFNSYTTALDLAETIVDYGKSLKYQIGLNVSLTDKGAETPSMTVGGDVTVAVRELEDEETLQFDLFNGKCLKVQGDLDITNNGVRHLVDLLYSNVDEGLYLTYSHGRNISADANTPNTEFNALIQNTNMSEIISMIVKFLGLNLSENILKAWNIGYCDTDFSYIQSLLKTDTSVVDDTLSKADSALNSVESITKMLGLITLKHETDENGLTTTSLTANLNLNDDGTPVVATILIKQVREESEDVVGEATIKTVRQISLSGLVVGGKTLSLTISLDDFDEKYFDYNTQKEHINFSSISSFIDTVVSTVNQKGFNFTGTITANVIGIITLNIDADIEIVIDDKNEISAYLQFVSDPGGLASAAFDDWGFLGIGAPDKRASIFEFKQGKLYLSKYDIKGSSAEKKNISTSVYDKSDIVPNLTTIIRDAFGFNNTIFDIIVKVISNIQTDPTLEEAIIGYTKTDKGFDLKVNAKNLLGDNSAEDMDLVIGTANVSGHHTRIVTSKNDAGEVVETKVTTDKIYSFIDSISTKMKMNAVELDLNLNSHSDEQKYSLKDKVGQSAESVFPDKEMFTNKYYRNRVANELVSLSFDANGGEERETLWKERLSDLQLSGLPDKYDVDYEAKTRKTYKFAGWYTSPTFEESTKFESKIMPETHTRLYAKWEFEKIENILVVNLYHYQDPDPVYRTYLLDGESITKEQLISAGVDGVKEDAELYFKDGSQKDQNFESYQANLQMSDTLNIYYRNYYTIEFRVQGYKIDGFGLIYSWDDMPAPPDPIYKLEGEIIELSEDKYMVTCQCKPKATSSKKTYVTSSWKTEPCKDGTKQNDGFTKYTVTGDQILYGCWAEKK